MHQLGTARRTAKALVENLLPRFFLRRMKSLIAHQLPKKTDRVVFCPLTATQADAYERFIDSDMVQYVKTASDPCDCGSGKKSGWCCREVSGDTSSTFMVPWKSLCAHFVVNPFLKHSVQMLITMH